MIKYSEIIAQEQVGYVSLSYEQSQGTTSPSVASDDYIPLSFNTERAENMPGYSLSGDQQITLPKGTYIAYIVMGSYSTTYYACGLAVAVETGDPTNILAYSTNSLEEGYTVSGSQIFHMEPFILTEESVLELFLAADASGTMTRNANASGLNEIRYTLTIVRMR